jgi:hypothetical protein
MVSLIQGDKMKGKIIVHIRDNKKNVLCGANYGGKKGLASITLPKDLVTAKITQNDFIAKVYDKPNQRICVQCKKIFKNISTVN